MGKNFELNTEHKQWIRRRRNRPEYGRRSIEYWGGLIQKQNGRCALTGAPLFFEAKYGTPQRGKGCHPLYASVDHIDPGGDGTELQIVCYDINDLKGHLPLPLFESLKRTKAWKKFKVKWKKIAEEKISLEKKREKLKQLIREGK